MEVELVATLARVAVADIVSVGVHSVSPQRAQAAVLVVDILA